MLVLEYTYPGYCKRENRDNKALEEHGRQLDVRIHVLHQELQDSGRLNGMNNLMHKRKNQAITRGVICLQQNRNQDEPVGINEGQRSIYNVPLPKVELPTFHRDNPRVWVRKCRKFFKLHFTNSFTLLRRQNISLVRRFLD